jgi:ABC-type sugar transport system substrate-binding protein
VRTQLPRAFIAVAAVPLMLLAACGGSGSADAAAPSSPAAAADAQAAAERVAPSREQPTAITISEPLVQRPPTGKKVYWLEGNIPAIQALTPGFRAATSALGWELSVLTYDATDPQGPSAAMQQAVQGGADYIAVSGQTADILGQGLDAAKAANIPVIDMYSTDEARLAENGLYANVGGPEFSRVTARALTDFVVSDSGGDAKVLFVNIPDFAILRIVAEAVSAGYGDNCAACELNTLDVSTQDVAASNAASAIVSRLQADPSIDYVHVAIGDLATGLPEALESAGLADRVKIVGSGPNQEQVQSLIDGKSAAYTVFGRPESAWMAVDVMARLAVGMEIDPQEHVQIPVWLLTPDTVPTPAQDYPGTAGHAEQFTKLWLLT